jgi:pimeloyl-[acyl-carrier protein] methyl ester esterase
MGRLAVGGDRAIYFEHYPGTGRPVVLVHGWGMSCRVWDTVLPALIDAGHEVASLDHRACGQSDKDFTDVSVASIAADVVALVAHLGLDRPVLNGWSLGGAVVAEAAGKLGDNLGGLVLTAGATPRYVQGDGYPYGGTPEILAQTIAALRADRATFLAGLSAGVCHANVGQPVIDWLWRIFMEAAPAADAALADLGNIDHRGLLPTVNSPALVMAGTHDQIVPFDIARVAADLLPNGRLVEFDASGHAPFLEEGDRYRSELLAFCRAL